MSSRPRIGITMDSSDAKPSSYKLNVEYARAIELAGGLPLPIPFRTDHALIPDYLGTLDGILFTGGNDLDPVLYGQEWHDKAVPVDKARQSFEFALLAEVERRRMPTLAICLGCQVLNVFRGGTLHQFIPDLPGKQEHRRLGDIVRRHEVDIEPGAAIAKAIGKTRVLANTYHKQAINRAGRGLIITARADDGIVEAIEDPSFPLLVGVQWHPERLTDEPEHRALFTMLIRACGLMESH